LSTPRVVVCFDYKVFAPNAGGHLGSVFSESPNGPQLDLSTPCPRRRVPRTRKARWTRGAEVRPESSLLARGEPFRPKSLGQFSSACRAVPRAVVAGFSVGLGGVPERGGFAAHRRGLVRFGGYRGRERGSLRFHLLSVPATGRSPKTVCAPSARSNPLRRRPFSQDGGLSHPGSCRAPSPNTKRLPLDDSPLSHTSALAFRDPQGRSAPHRAAALSIAPCRAGPVCR
jgi:hypothetical protein